MKALSGEEEERKKKIFESMSPRRQQHILKRGYEKAKTAGKELLGEAFGESIKMLNRAWSVDFSTGKIPENRPGT